MGKLNVKACPGVWEMAGLLLGELLPSGRLRWYLYAGLLRPGL